MKKARTHVTIITGLSGAGKSVVTRCLEDLGYTCIDNLPLEFIEPLVKHLKRAADRHWAAVVDVRNPNIGKDFQSFVERLRERFPDVRVIFVEASTGSIVRRFSETRRPHPFRQLPLADAVKLEREEMAPIRALADEVLDTSDLTPHELRAEVASRFGTTEEALPMVVRCESFGFRYGPPTDANLVLDVRYLPNPHFVPELRPHPGDSPDVRAWLEARPEVTESFDRFADLVEFLLPQYRREQKSYVVISFGCTGGRHRSVYFADRLARLLESQGWVATVRHRDRDRDG